MSTLKNYDINRLHEKWAKDWAAANGYKGFVGGWIYSPASAMPEAAICQGWSAFWRKFRRNMLNEQVRKVSLCGSFQELVERERPPALDLSRDWRNVVLAEEYNAAQVRAKQPKWAECHSLPKGLAAWQVKELSPKID